jgi:hypothetical protein
LGYGIYNYGPFALENFNRLATSSSIQTWGVGGTHQINKVSDVFKLENGKSAFKTIRALLFNNLIDKTDLDYSSTANAWYSGVKKVEERGTGLGLPIIDDVLSMFTRATYFTDVMSYKTTKTRRTVLNVASNVIGATNRDRTLDLYSKQLGMDRKYLDLVQYLVYEGGNVFEGAVDEFGRVSSKGKALNSVEARLVDKGKFTEALLGIINPLLGVKNPHTGGTYAEGIGGSEGYVLLGKGDIDKQLTGTLKSLAHTFNYKGMLFGKKGSLINRGPFKILASAFGAVDNDGIMEMTDEGIHKISNAILYGESYASMGLQRTSNLITEGFNELGNFFEYLSPSVKNSVYSELYKKGLTPRMHHGHGVAMLGRYSKLASVVGIGLAAVNQIGYTMQHGNKLTSGIAGGIQATALALAGAYIGKRFGPRGTGIGAMVGAGLGMLGMAGIGPFAPGPIPGVANLLARGNEIRSYVGEYTGMNWLRRKAEEVMPGSTTPTAALGMGFLLGTAYVTASRYLNRNTVIEHSQREKYLASGFGGDADISLRQISERIRERAQRIAQIDRNFERTSSALEGDALERARELHKTELRMERGVDFEDLSEQQVRGVEKEVLNYVESLEQKGEHGVLTNRLGKTLDARSNFANLAERLTEFTYGRERDKLLREETTFVGRFKRAIDVAPRPRAVAYAAIAGAATWFVGTGGLGTKERPHELRELNQGKRLEAVRRNQKWEMGQGGYEGGDILFYRPTLTARLSSGAAQAGASGNRGPLEEFFLKNFTYELERENYYSRPAPITGAAFDQVPFIYPLIQPITDLIKRPKLMHVSEWAQQTTGGNVSYLERSDGLDEIPDPSLGGIAMPAPVSPYSSARVFGKMWNETTSLSGLVGFYAKAAKNFLTGTPGFADQRSELESFSQNMDIDSKFYDLQGGGSFLGIPFTSEIIRRFVHKNELEQYNPIRNNMPSWMPEALQYGNQYTGVRYGSGEYRLPGEGYEALHPELKGMNPEQYPLIHQLNILGDVAGHSSQYQETLAQAKLMQYQGDMTDSEQSFFYKHQQNMRQKREKSQYDSYRFKPSSYDFLSGTVASVDPESMTFTLEEYGGRFGVAGISNDMSALISDFNLSSKKAAKLRRSNQGEFLDALSVGSGVSLTVPASIGQAVDESGVIKAAISNNGFNVNKSLRSSGDFARESGPMSSLGMTNYLERIIGAAWEGGTHFLNKMAQPIEHIGMFGAAPINKLLPFRDALEDYEAREVYGTEMKGWDSPIKDWIAPAIRTAIHNITGIDFQSPALREKRQTEEYFDKLKYLKYSRLENAATESGDALMARQYSELASETNVGSTGFVSTENLDNILGGREAMFASGFARESNPNRQAAILDAIPDNKRGVLENYYLGQDMDAINRAAAAGPMSSYGMDYAADLNRRKQEAEISKEQEARKEVNNFFQYRTLPKVDWIGFNPAVDLEDVKIKYLENEGMNFHDFGIFPSRANYMSRKSYIDEAAVEDINNLKFRGANDVFSQVNRSVGGFGEYRYNIQGPQRRNDHIDLEFTRNININPLEGN